MPSASWLQRNVDQLEGGVVTPEDFVESMLGEPQVKDQSLWIMRLYGSIFLRLPDFGGYDYWVKKLRAGIPLEAIATYFCDSDEFRARYGALDDAGFIAQVYRNVFEREADASGTQYYGQKLANGTRRGGVMLEMCGSAEYQQRTFHVVRISTVYSAMVRRMPDEGGLVYWYDQCSQNPEGIALLANSFLASSEYRSRF